jgi:hypothetical protein
MKARISLTKAVMGFDYLTDLKYSRKREESEHFTPNGVWIPVVEPLGL